MADDLTPGPPGEPKLLRVALPILAIILVAVIGSSSLFLSALEKSGAGAEIGPRDVADGIIATATVTSVDPLRSEMSIRLSMDPVGSLDDNGLLDKPVTLYYSSIDGTKQIEFKANKPFGHTDLVVPLIGDSVSKYPWDSYVGDIQLEFLTGESTSATSPASGTVLASTLTVYENVPAYTVLDASGQVVDGVLQAHFEVKRAPTAQFFSVLVTVVMWALALGVLLIAVSVVLRRRKLELAHMTMMAAILFAMPAALRGFQPGIPPPGVLSDFYGFFWCDVIVAGSLIAVVACYLRRKPA